MKNTSLVADLLKGSEAIDKAKEDLRLVTSIIVGIMFKVTVNTFKTFDKNYKTAGYFWEVVAKQSENKHTVSIRASRHAKGSEPFRWIFWCLIDEEDKRDKGNIVRSLEDVMRIRRDFPDFLEQLFKDMPDLKKSCDYFLEAAHT